jgi:hypothetical protein
MICSADFKFLSINNNVSSAVIFLDTEEAIDKIWYLSLLYEYAKLQFPVRIMKVTYSSLSIRKWKVSTNCEVAVPRETTTGVPPGC